MAFILRGVKMEAGAVIAARSVVTKDVPPYAFVIGVPTVIKNYRFDEKTIKRLLQSEWWQYALWDLKGVQVDDFEVFFERVKDLKIAEDKMYRPSIVNLLTNL